MPENETVNKEAMIVLTVGDLENFATSILARVNDRIGKRIVNVVDDTSDDNHAVSAAAVNQLIKSMGPGVTLQAVTGPMPETPSEKVIYLQRDSEADPTYTMYVYVDVANDDGSATEKKLVSIGSTDIQLENYYGKNDTDHAAMKTAMGLDTTLADGGFMKNDADTKALVQGWIAEAIRGATSEEVNAATAAAFDATEPDV